VLLHFGDMPKETVNYNTTRFAQDVMPRLRPMWSEWEDQWWPTDTLPELAQPAAVSGKVPSPSGRGLG